MAFLFFADFGNRECKQTRQSSLPVKRRDQWFARKTPPHDERTVGSRSYGSFVMGRSFSASLIILSFVVHSCYNIRSERRGHGAIGRWRRCGGFFRSRGCYQAGGRERCCLGTGTERTVPNIPRYWEYLGMLGTVPEICARSYLRKLAHTFRVTGRLNCTQFFRSEDKK